MNGESAELLPAHLVIEALVQDFGCVIIAESPTYVVLSRGGEATFVGIENNAIGLPFVRGTAHVLGIAGNQLIAAVTRRLGPPPGT